jgi:hypothetical protein
MDQCPHKLELESQRIASTPCMEACNVDALITTNPQYQVPKTVCNRDVGLDVDLVGVDRAAAAVHGKS